MNITAESNGLSNGLSNNENEIHLGGELLS